MVTGNSAAAAKPAVGPGNYLGGLPDRPSACSRCVSEWISFDRTGHTRWKAAQKLDLEKVPVHVATDLSPEQARAYRIADNKTAELAEWDYELLPIELGELAGLNYDLKLLGFSEEELARLLDPGVKEDLCDPDEVHEPPDEPITQRGDLWLLGEHRLCALSAVWP